MSLREGLLSARTQSPPGRQLDTRIAPYKKERVRIGRQRVSPNSDRSRRPTAPQSRPLPPDHLGSSHGGLLGGSCDS